MARAAALVSCCARHQPTNLAAGLHRYHGAGVAYRGCEPLVAAALDLPAAGRIWCHLSLDCRRAGLAWVCLAAPAATTWSSRCQPDTRFAARPLAPASTDDEEFWSVTASELCAVHAHGRVGHDRLYLGLQPH